MERKFLKPTTSPQKVAANRRNARRSTGPRTDAGKMIVSRNHLVHAMGSTAFVLPSEDAAQWEHHLTAIISELAPSGYLQQELARQVAVLTWRLRRVHRYETESARLMHDNALDTAMQMNAGRMFPVVMPDDIQRMALLPDNGRMKKVMRYEAHLSRLLARSLTQLDAIRHSHRQDLLVVATLARTDSCGSKPAALAMGPRALPGDGIVRA
jgi:hypothetical protein